MWWLLRKPAEGGVFQADAAADGTLETITAAGAYLLPTGCGACAALGAGILAENEVCISSTNRNFKGRQGSPTGRTLLMSPAMVAAAAIAGEVTDVRALVPVKEGA